MSDRLAEALYKEKVLRRFGRHRRGRWGITIALALALVSVASVWSGTARAAAGGTIFVTGHDMDLHCKIGNANECSYLKIALQTVRNGSSLPVLLLDQGTQLSGAITRAYSSGAPTVDVVNPTGGTWATLPLVSDGGAPLYSAIAVASDSTCGGCDNTSTGENAISARASDIATYISAGGGVLALSGARNGAAYYAFLPLPATGAAGRSPYTVTALGESLGVTSTMANCCATHNSFSQPPEGSLLQPVETDASGAPESMLARNVFISGGTITSSSTSTTSSSTTSSTTSAATTTSATSSTTTSTSSSASTSTTSATTTAEVRSTTIATTSTAPQPADSSYVSGLVTHDGAQALAGAVVFVGNATDVTDTAGHYHVGPLPAGDYQVRISYPAAYVAASPSTYTVNLDGTNQGVLNFYATTPSRAADSASVTPPPFRSFWVETLRQTTLWSGPDAAAVVLGTARQWDTLLVVLPQRGSRLYVYNPATHNYAYVDASEVGPAGSPR